VAYGVRRWGNADLRTMCKADIDEQIARLGLSVPPADRDRRIF
jgi:1,2-phenylacetyl-CoA epoxidase catalytic subunit